MMGPIRRQGRGRWQRIKSRRKLERPVKNSGQQTAEQNEFGNGEPNDRLVLSALNYWEVKRDLIEERLATMRSATHPSKAANRPVRSTV